MTQPTKLSAYDAMLVKRDDWRDAVKVPDADADGWVRDMAKDMECGRSGWTVSGDTLVAVYKDENGEVHGYMAHIFATCRLVEAGADE